jgi:hypothetical protein
MTRFSSHEIQRHMAQDRHILCAIALANATIVFPKADIKDPMERIFYAAVFPHRLGEMPSITGKRRQEKPLLHGDLTPYLTGRLHQAHTGDIRPGCLHA